jgi:hypothetical protein
VGDPAEWTYRGRLRNMLGYDTAKWGASESMRDGELDYFAYVDDQFIEIKRIVWGVGENFSLAQPSMFHMNAMSWSDPVALENQIVGLKLASTNGVAFTGDLEAFTRNAFGKEIPAPMDSLGLATRPVLGADTVVIPWYTRRWPYSRPATEPMPLRVAMSDGTASTPWMQIYYNPIHRPAPHGPGGWLPEAPEAPFPPRPDVEPEPPPVPGDTISHAHSSATPEGPLASAPPRVLHDSPLGDLPALAFELAVGGDVKAEVFDLQGRRVAVLAERPFGPGAHVLPWDGRDATGLQAARGLYFVRLALPGRTWGLRLLLDR